MKFPDASSLKLKMTGSVLLKTAFVLMCLVMMRINSILMLKKTDPLMTTSYVLVGPMMMMTGPLMMQISGDDDQPHDGENKFVYTEEDTMELCLVNDDGDMPYGRSL